MKSKLIKSFIVLYVFWLLVTTLLWSLSDPMTNLAALQRINSMLPFLNLSVPDHITVLEALPIQLKVLGIWTLPLLGLVALSISAGVGFVWLVVLKRIRERAQREAPSIEYRGVQLTVGEAPLLKTLPREEIELDVEDFPLLRSMSKDELALLNALIGIGVAHPDAYGSPAGDLSLCDYMLTKIEVALTMDKHPNLMALLVAANELGKINGYIKKGDNWVQVKDVQKEAARAMAATPEWFALPSESREALLLAVKYFEAVKTMPEYSGAKGISKLAKELVYAGKGLHQSIAANEKNAAIARAVEAANQEKLASQPSAPAQPAPAMARPQQPVSQEIVAPQVQQSSVDSAVDSTYDIMDSAVTDYSVIEEQPAEVLELHDVIFNAFIKALPALPFQSRGLPKGVNAVAWKVGNRVFLAEIKLRDTIMGKLPADLRAALTPKEKLKIQPFTQELLKAFQLKGWLVTSINGTTINAAEGLWNIKAGQLEFKGIIVIDVPAENMAQLPSDDSMYKIEVSGPWRTSAVQGQGSMGRNELAGVLNTKPAPKVSESEPKD